MSGIHRTRHARESTEKPDAPASTGKRPSDIEVEMRLQFTENALVETCNDRRAALMAALQFNVAMGTAQRWVRVVHQRWVKEAAKDGPDREAIRREHRSRLIHVYCRSIAAGGHTLKTALGAAEKLAQLDGLLIPSREPPRPPGPERTLDDELCMLLRGGDRSDQVGS